MALETLPAATKRKALWDNPVRLYGLEREAARVAPVGGHPETVTAGAVVDG